MDKVDVPEIKKQIQTEVAAATIQELIEDITQKCYSTCIKKPGTALDSYEQRCLGNCMDRFIDSYNVVSRVFTSRIETRINES